MMDEDEQSSQTPAGFNCVDFFLDFGYIDLKTAILFQNVAPINYFYFRYETNYASVLLLVLAW